MGIHPSQSRTSGQASGCDFDGVLGDIEVHEVREGGVVGESIEVLAWGCLDSRTDWTVFPVFSSISSG
jgi:hypothetical protein